jgi:hypothetical protein
VGQRGRSVGCGALLLGALVGGGGLTAPPLVSEALGCSGFPGGWDAWRPIRSDHVATNGYIVVIIDRDAPVEDTLSKATVEVLPMADAADADAPPPIPGTLVHHAGKAYLWKPARLLPESATLLVSLNIENVSFGQSSVTTAEGPVVAPSGLAARAPSLRARLEYTGDVISCMGASVALRVTRHPWSGAISVRIRKMRGVAATGEGVATSPGSRTPRVARRGNAIATPSKNCIAQTHGPRASRPL